MTNFSNFKSQALETSKDLAGVTIGGTSIQTISLRSELPLSGISPGDMYYVTENNTLYVNASNGWYTIALINENPTISGDDNSRVDLSLDGTPVVITLSAEDPEGSNIVWAYSVSGDTQAITVNQDGSTFTITPSTVINDQGIATITFTATDDAGNLSYLIKPFELSFVSEYWKSVSLSVGTSSADGLNNSAFIDRSTNDRPVTPSGSPVQTAFHPYYDSWGAHIGSTYGAFSGDNPFTVPEGEFTIECWVRVSAYQSDDMPISNTHWDRGNNAGWRLYLMSNGTVQLTASNGAWNSFPSIFISTNTYAVGQWCHIAIQKNSSNKIHLYIDGVRDTSVDVTRTTSLDLASAATAVPRIGRGVYDGNTHNNMLNYDLSKVRISTVARYSNDFDPYDQDFSADANTRSLMLHDKREHIEGTVTTTHTWTSVSEKSVIFGPDNGKEEYAIGENKGSLYSPSVGGGSVSVTAGDGLVSGDFTIEGWFYLDGTGAASSYGTVINNGGQYSTQLALSYGDQGLYHRIYVGTLQRSSYTQGWMISTDKYALLGRWNHIAMVRDDGKIYLYLNGVKRYFAEWTSRSYVHEYIPNTATLDANFIVGGWHGYTSDVKFTDSAVYTTDFTPPTEPVSSTNADLYLPMDNAGIFDKTGNNNLTLVGNTSTSTTQTKLADTSIYFDGSGDYLQVPYIALDNNPWTVEMWAYQNSAANTTLMSQGGSSVSAWSLSSSGTFTIQIFRGGNRVLLQNAGSFQAGQWNHCALVCDGTNLTIYLNGNDVGSVPINSSYPWNQSYSTHPLKFGVYDYNNSGHFNGYMENIQVLTGVAKYTTNFTPPTRTQGKSVQENS